MEQKVRVRMLVSVASPWGCPMPGEEIEIPLEDALSWQAAGYCEILTEVEHTPAHRPRRRASDVRDR